MRKSLFFLLCLFLSNSLISTASAHQPRIVYQKQISKTNPIIVTNPEISQAFYAELKGQPEYYTVNSAAEFTLYVRILSPKITDAKKDFSVEIIRDANVIARLNGSSSTWTEFYEPFVGDDYWQGPQYKEQLPKGDYLVKVSNSDSRGKYVLVVGQAEAFPLNETLKLFVSLPQLKHYFGKSGFTAFFNLVGLFWLIQIIILSLIIVGIVWIVKKVRKKMLRTPL
jgi:hypothetical protein